jgi:hypothetical protein
MSEYMLGQLTVWGFVLTLIGLGATLWGVRLTYLQAQMASKSADLARQKVEEFSAKRDKSEAIQCLARAVQSMEVASVLIDSDKWKDACSSYDEARRAVQTVRSMSIKLNKVKAKQLSLLAEHLRAFSDTVDNAMAEKGGYPDKAKVRSAIRKNCDDLNLIQRELHEGLT